MKDCNLCGAGVVSAPAYNMASSCDTPPTQLETVTIPKNKGGDGPNDPYAPTLGAWRNTIVVYQKTKSVYLYDVNGVYTNLTGTDYASQILTMQEAITNLQTSTDTLQSDLETETTARKNTDDNLQGQIANLVTGLANETSAREATDTSLSQQVTAMATQVNEIGTQVNSQGADLQTAISNLNQSIQEETNARTATDTTIQNQVTTNTDAITALQSAVGGPDSGLVRDVFYSLTANAGSSTVDLIATTGPLNNPDTTETTIPLPVASESIAGVMNAETYIAFQSNSENVDAILNGAVALDNIPATPTQEQLTTAWSEATGKTALINRASIYDSANKKVWYYYTNTGQWVSVTSGDAPVSIATATNTSLGVTMGSTEEGQIAIEANGRMSVNGWDTQVAQIANNTTQIAALQTTIGTIQSVLTQLDSGTGV